MSDLAIQRVVIHALNKEQHKKISESTIRSTLLDSSHPAVIKTVEGVVDVYGTRHNNAHYGIFQTDGDGRGAFPDAFESYAVLAPASDDQFLDLTRSAMSRLYDKASANHASSGGNIVFAEYTRAADRFFLMAMIKQKPGITLRADLQPEELMHLDLTRLHQAARISYSRLSEYQCADEEERKELSYLSFVSPATTKTASGYFVTALGCSQGTASSAATKTLIVECRKFFHEKEELRSQREAFRQALDEYLKDKHERKESVKLSEVENVVRRYIPADIGERAEELTGQLLAHLNSESCRVPVEFPVGQAALKRFTHIAGEAPSWKMSFVRSALGDSAAADVYWDAESEKLILRKVPQAMREQIEQELADRNGPDR